MIWIAATLIAATAQTARNAAQAALTRQTGTIGATAVRFIFGLPFAVMLLTVAGLMTPLPRPDAYVLAWTIFGAGSQIAATALMLMTMRDKGFGVATALTKTEPVSLALIGTVVLAEPLGPARLGAIVLASIGVAMASGAGWGRAAWTAVGTGLLAGILFGFSAIGFRGALLGLPDGSFLIRAITVLAITLMLQAAAMLFWMILRDRAGLRIVAREWRMSLGAGALGAFASLFWFIGFALTPAANVRTLALVEVIMAQILSGKLFRERINKVQLTGMALIVIGVGWLMAVVA